MTKDDIQLLYEYDRWANNRAWHAASTLNAEEFTRDLGGSFRSVRDTLVHIVGSQWAWLTYWKEPSPSSAFVEDVWTRHDALFNPNAFPDLAAVRLKWAEVERELVDFVNRVTTNPWAGCFLFAQLKSLWRTSCNIWRTIPLTIGVKPR